MFQLEQQQRGEFVGGVVVVDQLTPTTYIQLAGAGSIAAPPCVCVPPSVTIPLLNHN